jgi:hypothetical protein
MRFDADQRYLPLLEELGSSTRWFQLGADVPFATVVAAVDGVVGADVVARREALTGLIGAGDEAALVTYTLAAVSAARGVEAPSLIAAADSATDVLKAGIRSKRICRIAGVILAVDDPAGCELKAGRTVSLYQEWNLRHRVRTNTSDLLLAAVGEAAGVDGSTALDRANLALDRLATGGYPGEWDLARILALEPPSLTVERYLRLAAQMRGRRRRLVADRRSSLALACLADHPSDQLSALLLGRVRDLRWGKHRPNARTVLTLGALLTLGASVPSGHRLRDAFHAFALREQNRTALEQAPSG